MSGYKSKSISLKHIFNDFEKKFLQYKISYYSNRILKIKNFVTK